jgi:hypothetical protein
MDIARDAIRDSADPRIALRDVIERCAAESADPAWGPVAEIDFERIWETDRVWFDGLVRDEPPGDAINGLWFGVFNPVRDDGVVASDFYAAGSSRFGDDPEWMAHLEWWPENRYAHSDAQAQIYELGSRGSPDTAHLADYVLTFAHAALTARRLLEEPSPAVTTLAALSPLAVAVGHDSGDGVLLGTLTPTGFERGRCDWI